MHVYAPVTAPGPLPGRPVPPGDAADPDRPDAAVPGRAQVHDLEAVIEVLVGEIIVGAVEPAAVVMLEGVP